MMHALRQKKNIAKKILIYGVDSETGMIFPLWYFCPSRANIKMNSAIWLAVIDALNPGNAFCNISVCTAPSAKQFTVIFVSFNSSAKHSVKPHNAALLEEYALSPANFAEPCTPPMLLIFTMCAPFFLFNKGKSACVSR